MNEHRKNGVFEVRVHVKKVLISEKSSCCSFQQEDFFAHAGYLTQKCAKTVEI